MASIERTAYPQFKRNPVVRELVVAYTPTDAELTFIADNARQPGQRFLRGARPEWRACEYWCFRRECAGE